MSAVPPTEWKPSTWPWPSELTETVPKTCSRRARSRMASPNASRPSGTGSRTSLRTPANSGSWSVPGPR